MQILALLKIIFSAFPAAHGIVKILDKWLTKTPAEKAQEIDKKNQEARDNFEKTGRPE